MSNYRVVAAFRPFKPEGEHHQMLADFDWMAALQMMADSVTRSCGCPVHAITDVDTDLPIPTLKYVTTQRRLMLWSLEACVAYLASDDFDRDTVLLDVDQLVYKDLAMFFATGVDLGILMRMPRLTPMPKRRLINGVQFWSLAGKDRLVGFYGRALAIAQAMPDNQIAWGADSDAVSQLLEPFQYGIQTRSGLTVRMHDVTTVLEALTLNQICGIQHGYFSQPTKAVLDFRVRRKRHMAMVYRMTIDSQGVLA